MRTIVYKDSKIPTASYNELISEYSAFITKYTGIKPIWYTKEYDFTDYPTIIDGDGDDVVRPDFLQAIADDVDTKYGEWGADHIVTLIHIDNWKSGPTPTRKVIWGTNYSYRYNNYHIQYVRWDKRNKANTFGTLNHEQDHSYDALIKQEIGVNVNPILGVPAYDKYTTHGGRPGEEEKAYHGYIKYQENAAKLKVLAPYLIAAYKKRQDAHTEHIKGLQLTAINLLKQVVYWWTAKLNRKTIGK
jgi:uncharacterized short protein YbdD (DUF466 family)